MLVKASEKLKNSSSGGLGKSTGLDKRIRLAGTHQSAQSLHGTDSPGRGVFPADKTALI